MNFLEEWGHWLLWLFVLGTIYVIFARDTKRTGDLFKVGTGTYDDLVNTSSKFGAIS